MHQLTVEHLNSLRGEYTSPCISLYVPAHRHVPDSTKDPICYRNSLKELEISLNKKYSEEEVHSAMKKFQQLAHDETFWNHRTDGLAIFSSPDTFQIFELQRTVPQLLVVANNFHIKPLIQILQSADSYQLLCLTRTEAKLYEGNRDHLNAVELANVPATIIEALGAELTEPHLTVASAASGFGGSGTAVHHGHGGKKPEIDIDTERFFRVIDRALLEYHSHPAGLPLMLAALPEHQATFRAITNNSFLLEEGIFKNPESFSVDELRQKAWQQMEPVFSKRLSERIETYKTTLAAKQASDDVTAVAAAVMAGRVAVLLVEADRQIPGRVNASGDIEPGKLSNPEVGDIIDDLAEAVLRMKGEVVVVPKKLMPSKTGLAATFRY
ncbi:hypothetical protein KBI23_01320 [bacterium]|nr:hypothetical protein [bacterium]